MTPDRERITITDCLIEDDPLQAEAWYKRQRQEWLDAHPQQPPSEAQGIPWSAVVIMAMIVAQVVVLVYLGYLGAH